MKIKLTGSSWANRGQIKEAEIASIYMDGEFYTTLENPGFAIEQVEETKIKSNEETKNERSLISSIGSKPSKIEIIF